MSKLILPFLVSLLVLTASGASSSRVRIEMRGFQVTPRNQAQVNALNNFFDTNTGYYFRGGRVQLDRSLEILVPQELKTRFLHVMTAAGMSYSVLYDRVKMKFYGRSENRQLTENFLSQDEGDDGPQITEDCIQGGNFCGDAEKCCNKNGCDIKKVGPPSSPDVPVCN